MMDAAAAAAAALVEFAVGGCFFLISQITPKSLFNLFSSIIS
jgi:hypothetical protein